ncbi:MAG: GDP-mannose 4,6-dehydratase [Alphaproteobacteria bacterium]|nr:GDP-mannose 4,6-dehydratase [Alphaproteobacteria bacterium]
MAGDGQLRDFDFAKYNSGHVEGMWRMLQRREADDYVLATGIGMTIRGCVNFTAEAPDMDLDWQARVSARLRLNARPAVEL